MHGIYSASSMHTDPEISDFHNVSLIFLSGVCVCEERDQPLPKFGKRCDAIHAAENAEQLES